MPCPSSRVIGSIVIGLHRAAPAFCRSVGMGEAEPVEGPHHVRDSGDDLPRSPPGRSSRSPPRSPTPSSLPGRAPRRAGRSSPRQGTPAWTHFAPHPPAGRRAHADHPLLQQADVGIGDDLVGADERLDLLHVPLPRALLAAGPRVRARGPFPSAEAACRSCRMSMTASTTPLDLVRLRRAAGDDVVDVHHLRERPHRVPEVRDPERPLRHLRTRAAAGCARGFTVEGESS